DDPRRLSQADVLFQGRSAEGPATPDNAIDRAISASLALNSHFDSGADGRPVGRDTHESQVDPVVSVTRILEQSQWMTVSWCRATDFSDDLLVAVVVQIGKRDPVPFVELAGPG